MDLQREILLGEMMEARFARHEIIGRENPLGCPRKLVTG